MKTMKKITAILLVMVMALSLAACGATEKTLVLRGDLTDQTGGIPAIDTWTLNAKGDIVQTLKEVLEVDLSDFDDETKEAVIAMLDGTILDAAEGIDGVVCTGKRDGDTYTIEFTIDCTGDGLKDAAAAGLVTLDGDSDYISLKQTQAAMTSQGYEVVE